MIIPAIDDIGIILGLFSAFLSGCCVILAIKNFIQSRNRSSFFFAQIILLNTFALIMETISYIIPNISTVRITILLYIPILFNAIIFIDSITRDSIDPLKIFIAALFSCNLIHHLFQDQAILLNPTIKISNPLLYSLEIMNLFTGWLLVHYIAKLHIQAPKKSKSNSRKMLFGSVLFAGISAIILLINRALKGPLGIHLIFTGLGFWFIIRGWIKDPTLAFILPFSAIRLDVIDMHGGFSLFSYIWNKKANELDHLMYSSMLYGISGILSESIDQGKIRQIELEKGVIIIQQGKKDGIIVALLTTKSSKILRNALINFSKEFENQYTLDEIKERNHLIDNQQFAAAEKIIGKVFSFIPLYD